MVFLDIFVPIMTPLLCVCISVPLCRIYLLLCCANHVKGTENMKSQIWYKKDDLYSCGVQNMIRKRLLEIKTAQRPQALTKNIVSFVLKNTRIALTNQVNLH